MPTATPITETQNAESLFCKSPTVMEYRLYVEPKREFTQSNYYLVTEPNFPNTVWTESPIKVSDFNNISNHSTVTQFSVLSIASLMFSNSRPLEGKELDVLKRTFEKSLSNTPTTLRKK